MLYSHYLPGNGGHSALVLVFLHGLLGSGDDWDTTLTSFGDCSVLTIDLPGHGHSRETGCDGFEDCCHRVAEVIRAHCPPPVPVVLVGYSLGSRIAMYGTAFGLFNSLNLKGLIVEGGNFGLLNEQDKQARQLNDEQWARRFEQEPIGQVLSDWYAQAVFSSLNYEQRQKLILKRSGNLGASVAKMLRATSLAHQPYLLNELQQADIPVHYLYGDRDTKFRQIAQDCGLSFSEIAGAGHNAHREQPEQFAQCIREFISRNRAGTGIGAS